MATHPSTLAWKIAWTEEPGRLQTEWLKHRRLFLTVLEAEKSEIQGVSTAEFW